MKQLNWAYDPTALWAGWSGDQIPLRDEIFHTRPDWPWGPPSLPYNGYWVIPGSTAARAWH